MIRKCLLIVGIASLLLGGCTSQHELVTPRVSLSGLGGEDPSRQKEIEAAMTDRDIAEMLDFDVKARIPTKLAVAKVSNGSAHLEDMNGEELESWRESQADVPGIAGVHTVNAFCMGNSLNDRYVTLHELRQASARLGCELLLVYAQGDDYVNNFNGAAVLYWTLVGLWVAPGDTVEYETVMQAVIVDCRTGKILGTVGGSKRNSSDTPAAFVDITRADLADKTPQEALNDLQKNCHELLLKITARATEHSAHRYRAP